MSSHPREHAVKIHFLTIHYVGPPGKQLKFFTVKAPMPSARVLGLSDKTTKAPTVHSSENRPSLDCKVMFIHCDTSGGCGEERPESALGRQWPLLAAFLYVLSAT